MQVVCFKHRKLEREEKNYDGKIRITLVLKALAEKRNLSMTDYILLSALHYSAGEHYRHALKTLEQIRTELLALQKSNPGDAVSDALEKQMQLYDAALAAIRCT